MSPKQNLPGVARSSLGQKARHGVLEQTNRATGRPKFAAGLPTYCLGILREALD